MTLFRTTVSAVLSSLALASLAAQAEASTFSNVEVLGTAAIYGAGLTGNGLSTAPTTILFTAGIGNVLTLSSVTGATNCCNGTPTSPADGSVANTSVAALNGISGIVVPRQMFLAGVFINSADLPVSGAQPATLNYISGLSITDLSYTPLLNQAFFIGDGLSGATTQDFYAPDDADTLLLGFVDSSGFNGPPSYYGDNRGSLVVSGTITSAAVPLPAALPFMGVALAGLAVLRRQRA